MEEGDERVRDHCPHLLDDRHLGLAEHHQPDRECEEPEESETLRHHAQRRSKAQHTARTFHDLPRQTIRWSPSLSSSQYMLISTLRSVRISSRQRPVPSATQDSGSSATETGRPVACRRAWSRLLSSAPPPVSTMPLSRMSAASSGAVCSSATLTASTMALTGSVRLSEIWRSLMTSSFGTPFIRSRPLISIIRPSPSSGGQAEPISFLIRSAEDSPTSRLWLRRICPQVRASILSPPTRTEREYTMPPSDSTATSVVPPPMSTTIEPVGSVTGSPAPIAAAIGSSIRNTRRAPALSADSWMARRSTAVEPEGTRSEEHTSELQSPDHLVCRL